jgi:hypothetical protein
MARSARDSEQIYCWGTLLLLVAGIWAAVAPPAACMAPAVQLLLMLIGTA